MIFKTTFLGEGKSVKIAGLKKTRFPISNTSREPCRPALLDIGESLSAYLQAIMNILSDY